jgi:hypothetical protein
MVVTALSWPSHNGTAVRIRNGAWLGVAGTAMRQC